MMRLHRVDGLEDSLEHRHGDERHHRPQRRDDDDRHQRHNSLDALLDLLVEPLADFFQRRAEIAGLLALLDSDLAGPVNIGNPDERTISEIAAVVLKVTGSASHVVHRPLPTDDPTRRCPDITLASERLGWSPRVDLVTGLEQTAAYFGALTADEGRAGG